MYTKALTSLPPSPRTTCCETGSSVCNLAQSGLPLICLRGFMTGGVPFKVTVPFKVAVGGPAETVLAAEDAVSAFPAEEFASAAGADWLLLESLPPPQAIKAPRTRPTVKI